MAVLCGMTLPCMARPVVQYVVALRSCDLRRTGRTAETEHLLCVSVAGRTSMAGPAFKIIDFVLCIIANEGFKLAIDLQPHASAMT